MAVKRQRPAGANTANRCDMRPPGLAPVARGGDTGVNQQTIQQSAGAATIDVLIIGGGVAGTTVAACIRDLRNSLRIALVEPEPIHHYRPGWTLVAAGQASAEAMQRPRAQCMPAGVEWIVGKVEIIDAEARRVELADGRQLSYRVLIVAVGLYSDWASVEGLEDSLGCNGVNSIYRGDLAETTRTLLESFRGGRALFVRSRLPIQCAGSAQSILYVTADRFRRAALQRRAC
jgi:sulfide:quinone oxidoreductase